MKKYLLFLLLIPSILFAQSPCSAPADGSVTGTEKVVICDNGITKTATITQIRGSGGGGGDSLLSTLRDVSFASLIATNMIVYRTSDSKWHNVSMNGDATMTQLGVITVNGIKGSIVPTLTAGNLKFDGTNWVFDNATYLTSVGTSNITNGAVTYAKIQNESARSILGNPTNSSTAPSEIFLDSTTTVWNGKIAVNAPTKIVSGTSYTPTDADNGYSIHFTNAGLVTLTLPTSGLRPNFIFYPLAKANKVRLVTSGILETDNDTIVGPRKYATVHNYTGTTWLATGALGTVTSGSGSSGVTSITSATADATITPSTGTPIVTINSAPKWTTPRTLSLTNDVTYTSPSFDGSGNVTAAATVISASPTVSGKAKLYADVTGNNTDGAPDQNSVKVALATKQATIPSQAAATVYAAPATTSSVPSAQTLRRQHVANLNEPIGQVVNLTFNNTASWTTTGSATFVESGSTLTVTGGSTKTLSNYRVYNTYGNSSAENWTMVWSNINAGTASSTSFGVGLGIQGSALAIQGAVLLDNTNRGRLAFYFNNGTATEDTSSAAITGGIATSDIITLQLKRMRNTYMLQLTNVTTGQVHTHMKTVGYDFGNTSYRPNNAGKFAQYSLGGTFTSNGTFTVSLDSYKYPKVLVLGDSEAEGAMQKSPEQRWATQLGRMINGYVEVNAGGGNLTTDINSAEALLYQPEHIFIALGTNDKLAATADATVKSRIDALVTSLTGSGATLWVISLSPNSSYDASTLNGLLKTTYGNNYIDNYSFIKNYTGTGPNPNAVVDGTHWNTEYQLRYAQSTFIQGVTKGIFTANPLYQSSFNAVYQDPQGRVSVSPKNNVQVAQLDVVSQGTQLRLDNTNTGGGTVVFSGTAGTIGHGLFFDGTNVKVTATTSSSIRFNAGDIDFFGNTGLTPGLNLTRTQKMKIGASSTQIYNGGLVVSGAGTTTSGSLDYYDTNGGAVQTAVSMFENGNSIGTLGSCGGFTTAGNLAFFQTNSASQRIRMAAITSTSLSSSAGVETGQLFFYTKKSTGGLNSVQPDMTLDDRGNVSIGNNNTSLGGGFTKTLVIANKLGVGTMAPLAGIHSATSIRSDSNKAVAGNEVLVASVGGVYKNLGTGAGVLTNNGSGTLTWGSAGMTNVLTTTGDVIYSSSGATPARRGVGVNGSLFYINSSGLPDWTPSISVQTASISGAVAVNAGLSTANVTGLGITSTLTNSSGVNNMIGIVGSVAQASTAGYRGLFISPFESATGSGIKMLIDAGTNSASLGSGTHTSKFSVDNTGTVSTANHFVSNGGTPTFSLGSGAGTGASASVSGTDMGGKITITTGTVPSNNSNVITLTFASSFGSQPFVTIGATDVATLGIPNTIVYASASTTTLSLGVGTTPLVAATTYVINYTIAGR